MIKLLFYIQALFRGTYSVFLEDWMKAYGRDKIHIVMLSEWMTDSVNQYKKLIHFLDLGKYIFLMLTLKQTFVAPFTIFSTYKCIWLCHATCFHRHSFPRSCIGHETATVQFLPG